LNIFNVCFSGFDLMKGSRWCCSRWRSRTFSYNENLDTHLLKERKSFSLTFGE